jgi:hypothetical protein
MVRGGSGELRLGIGGVKRCGEDLTLLGKGIYSEVRL